MMTIRGRNSLWTGVLLALVVAVTPVTAQDQGPDQDVDPRLERIRAELPGPALEQIETRIAAARSAGLPVEPLLDKAVEGIAKNIPAALIAGAIDQLGEDLGRARELLADGVPPAPADVAAVADAMRRGVPEEAIQELTEGADPEDPVALAVHTLGDLMDRGVPVDQAVSVLEAWQSRGARPEELRALPAAVDRLMRQGVLPGQAAAAVANAMREGPPGSGEPRDGQAPGIQMEGGPPVGPGADPPSHPGGDQGGDKGGGGPPADAPPGGGG